MLFGTILEIFCLLKKFVSTALAAHSIRELMCTSEVSERLIGRICPEISSQVSGLRSQVSYILIHTFFVMVVFLHSKEFWKLATKVKTNQKLRLFFTPRQTMAQFSGNYCSLKGRDSKLQHLNVC